jgi:hypothetical protein
MSGFLNIPKNTRKLTEQEKQANREDIANTFKVDDRPIMERLKSAFGVSDDSQKKRLAEQMSKSRSYGSDNSR